MKIFIALGLLFLVVLSEGEKLKQRKEKQKQNQQDVGKRPNQVHNLLEKLSDSNTQFSFDVYKILSKKESTEENIFFSPGSLSTALSMTLLGTGGKTSRELGKVLHWKPKYFSSFHYAMRGFLSGVKKMNADARNKFELVNRIWLQQDFPVRKDFVNQTTFYYFAPLQFIDFKESEQATQTINKWVKDKTRRKINNIIPDGGIDATTRFVLTNALFFKGAWEIEFNKSLTVKREFQVSENKTKMVSMMRARATFGYAYCNRMSLVELPYKGGNFSMIIIRPDKSIESVENRLDMKIYRRCTNNLRKKEVIVSMPKFKIRGNYKMKEVIQELGAESLFSPNKADFSGLVDPPRGENLYVDDIFHQSFVRLDEAGVEAASSTAVVIKERSMSGPINFYLDRPFLFTIQEKQTGAIFFLGKVAKP